MKTIDYVNKYNEIVRKCNQVVGRDIYLEAEKSDRVTPSQILSLEKLLEELRSENKQ